MKEEKDKIKKKTAVALSYFPGEQAPRIVATGRGYVAENIIEKAKESNVPLYKDEQLSKTLAKLEIGDRIPPELYQVIAEILVFVNDMEVLRGKLNG